MSDHHNPLLVLAALLIGVSPVQAAERADLRPTWLDSYQVWSGRAAIRANSNLSYLQTRQTALSGDPMFDPIVDQFDSLIDPGRAVAWRHQYHELNRRYEQRQLAGLSNPTMIQEQQGALAGFSNGVLEDIKQRKLRETGDAAVGIVNKNQVVKTVLAPGAIAAGIYIGRPVRVRLAEGSHFLFRTNFRDRFGQVELHSPFLYGSFVYKPEAAESYQLGYSSGVDFGKVMDFGNIVDFQSERYQLEVARTIPYVGLKSSVFYGSSSKVVAGSLSKQLTPSVSAVVDSIYYVNPYATLSSPMEERVRLKYDIHF